MYCGKSRRAGANVPTAHSSDLQPGPKLASDAQFDLHITVEVSLLHRAGLSEQA